MTHELRPIDVNDIPELRRLAEEVSRSGESRVLRSEEKDLAVLVPLAQTKPKRGKKRPLTKDRLEAFLSSMGGWKDRDTDSLVDYIYEERRVRGDRPPVEL